MFKFFLSLIFLLLTLSTFSFAAIDEGALKKEYGPNLTKAPFFLRYSFEKSFNVDWDKSYYSDRKAFLMNYEANVASENALAKEEAKQDAERLREKMQEKRDKDLKEKERLRAEQEQERQDQQDYDERQREMKEADRQQQQDLQQMQQALHQQ